MLEDESWRKPYSAGTGSTPSKDNIKGDVLARAMLNELNEWQVEHEKRIEVLLSKQESNILEKLKDLYIYGTEGRGMPPPSAAGHKTDIASMREATNAMMRRSSSSNDSRPPLSLMESLRQEGKLPDHVSLWEDDAKAEHVTAKITNKRFLTVFKPPGAVVDMDEDDEDEDEEETKGGLSVPVESTIPLHSPRVAVVQDDSILDTYPALSKYDSMRNHSSEDSCEMHYHSTGKDVHHHHDFRGALQQLKNGLHMHRRPSLTLGSEHTLKTKQHTEKFDDHVQALQQIKKQMAGGRGSTANLSERGQMGKYKCCRAASVVADRRFDAFIIMMIMTNSIIIGLQADQEIQNPLDPPPEFYRIANLVFIVVFTTELILRIIVEQVSFLSYHSPKIGWNVFDSFLVSIALIEEFLVAFATSTPDMSVMRILRTMRIVRGLRIVRVFAFFRDLRIMVAGIMYSMQSLVWAMLLLIGIMFLFSVCLLQFVIQEHVAQSTDDQSIISLNKDEYQEMMKYFGTLLRTIYTLYCSIVGGVDWGEAANPLMQLSAPLGLLYSCYIAFAILCVLNIITGVFVENASKTSAEDGDMVMIEEMENRTVWLQEVKEIFDTFDGDKDGVLDKEEFTDHLQDHKMRAWFRKIGVHVESYSAQGMFSLLDYDGDGKVDLDEFAMALHQVHGPARSIDVAKINREQHVLRNDVRELHAVCLAFFERHWHTNFSVAGKEKAADRIEPAQVSPVQVTEVKVSPSQSTEVTPSIPLFWEDKSESISISGMSSVSC